MELVSKLHSVNKPDPSKPELAYRFTIYRRASTQTTNLAHISNYGKFSPVNLICFLCGLWEGSRERRGNSIKNNM